jgi:hypothetical protein
MIYHYDLIASPGIIYCKTKSTLVRRVVEVSGFRPLKDGANPLQGEFEDLGFGYIKAVSIYPSTLLCANPAASLLPSRETDGVMA